MEEQNKKKNFVPLEKDNAQKEFPKEDIENIFKEDDPKINMGTINMVVEKILNKG